LPAIINKIGGGDRVHTLPPFLLPQGARVLLSYQELCAFRWNRRWQRTTYKKLHTGVIY